MMARLNRFGIAFGLGAALTACLASASAATAQTTMANQTVPGAGNAQAIKTARGSQLVTSAYRFIGSQIDMLQNDNLRVQSYDGIMNPDTCILHRANLTLAKKKAIVAELLAQGLLNKNDDATFPGGLLAGVFPPVLNDGTACPHLPQRFFSSPGSSFGGHHSYPGGLPVHESNNDTADMNLAEEYRNVYGHTNEAGFATVNVEGIHDPNPETGSESILYIDQDIIIGAPLWHDWAKPIVFQWNADGTEFQELSIGGNGMTDDYGAAGNAETGGHHIMSIAESMKRGFSPAFVDTQACAHSAPTSGNEFKVVNWLRAAAIIDGIDPVKKGFLTKDSAGNYRLPALRKVGEVSLLAATPSQTNIIAEFTIHNLSDADFTFSGPAVTADQLVLAELAPSFGFDPSDVANYNTKYRNVVLSNFSAERLYILYSNKGTEGVKAEIQKLRAEGKL